MVKQAKTIDSRETSFWAERNRDVRLDPDWKERIAALKARSEAYKKDNPPADTKDGKRPAQSSQMGTGSRRSTSGEKFTQNFYKLYAKKDCSNAISVLLPVRLIPKTFQQVNNG